MQRRGSVLGDRIRIGTCPDKAANDRPSGMGIPRAPARHTVGCIAEWFDATSIVGAAIGAAGNQVRDDARLIGCCRDLQGRVAGIEVVLDLIEVVRRSSSSLKITRQASLP
jgi:hypothetical protein